MSELTVKDETAETVDAAPNAAAAEKAEDALKSVMDEHGFDSIDELKAAIATSKEFRQTIGAKDLKKVVEDADRLARYEQYWAEQEALKKEENESPEDTIKRLKEELDGTKNQEKAKQTEEMTKKEAMEIVKTFEKVVETTFSEEKVPDEFQPYIREYLGLNNPILSVDPHDKKAIKTAAKDAIKKIVQFEQAVIKRYGEGKSTIPPITKTDTSVPAPKKASSFAEAAKMIKELRGV